VSFDVSKGIQLNQSKIVALAFGATDRRSIVAPRVRCPYPAYLQLGDLFVAVLREEAVDFRGRHQLLPLNNLGVRRAFSAVVMPRVSIPRLIWVTFGTLGPLTPPAMHDEVLRIAAFDAASPASHLGASLFHAEVVSIEPRSRERAAFKTDDLITISTEGHGIVRYPLPF